MRAPPLFLDIHREQRGGAGAPSNEQRSGLPQRPAFALLQRHRWLAANPGIDQLCWEPVTSYSSCRYVISLQNNDNCNQLLYLKRNRAIKLATCGIIRDYNLNSI